jgi:hypothetical protein
MKTTKEKFKHVIQFTLGIIIFPIVFLLIAIIVTFSIIIHMICKSVELIINKLNKGD